MRTVLTIAGSDPSGGAGIQADLKTFAALGVYGVSAITAITAQNTAGVADVVPLEADLVTAQIEAVAGDFEIHATKTGMLGTSAIVEAVAASIAALSLPNLVVDPVIRSTSGRTLLDDEGVETMKRELIPRARLVTPNIPEAERLSGRTIASLEDRRAAAEAIRDLGATAVIITGGHAGGADIVDLLFDGSRFVESRTPRVESPSTHGTGCTFASAVAAGIAMGLTLHEAITDAQLYVAGAIRRGLAAGRARGSLDHFWKFR